MTLSERYAEVRAYTEELAAPLSGEDQTVQSMPDVSPTKWHRAHTTWFFETFVLPRADHRYRVFHPEFCYLFNSYYEAVGARHPRAERGLLSRPGHHRDRRLSAARRCRDARRDRHDCRPTLLGARRARSAPRAAAPGAAADGHQARPVRESTPTGIPSNDREPTCATLDPSSWNDQPGGLVDIGHDGDRLRVRQRGAASPRVPSRRTPSRTALVSCGDWLEFIEDDGYRRPDLWLSDGWAVVQAEQLGSAAVLGARRSHLERLHVVGHEADRSGRTGRPRELLRS